MSVKALMTITLKELITVQNKDFRKLQIYSSLEMMRLATGVVKILLLL